MTWPARRWLRSPLMGRNSRGSPGDLRGFPGWAWRSDRPWFRHLIYAPGFYTGCAVKTLPDVREAIEQQNWELAEAEVERVAAALIDEATLVSLAADLVERSGR
jgi:Transferrin receptor-like dimerisation domain